MAVPTPNLSLWLGDHGDWPNTWDSPMRQNWNIVDALFDAATGHAHTGVAGDAPNIDHDDLLNGGAVSHATLDADLYKSKVTAVDTSPDYLMGAVTPKIVPGPSGNVTVTKLNAGAAEQIQIEVPSVTPTFGDAGDPSGEYGWKNFTPTSAPVAYTDNFCYPLGFPLTQGDYLTNMTTPAQEFLCSQVAAQSFVDTNLGEPLAGQYAAVVCCHIPHGVAQRTTLSISDFDYSMLQPGDGVCFTLSVFSTHVLGPILPQLYGVFLEIHFTVVALGVYQVSHRVVILPGDGSRIDLPSCVHTNPDDIEGCWELSLDANGHVYTYWRRTMVYSSQSSPPNVPGPVQAHISTLKATALAQGDPPYGSMGFGWQYNVLAGSQHYTEIRWLSVCSGNDLYHEDWECMPEPPLGVPEEIELPKVIFTDGGPYQGNPGTICCTGPTVKVGNVIGQDPGGTDIVVTAKGNTFSVGSDREFGSGYFTNVSTGPATPCIEPTGTPVLHQLSGSFAENDSGTLLITGVAPYCPNLHVESLTSGFNVETFAWVDYDELLITHSADDCTGGAPVTIRVSNVVKGNPVDIPLGTLDFAAPVIMSVDTEDTFYGDSLGGNVMEGVETLVTLHGHGFDPDVDVTSGQAFVGISDVTFIDCETVTFKVTQDFENGAPPTEYTVTNIGTGLSTGVQTISTTPMAPYIYNVDATTNAALTNNVIVTLYTRFTDQPGVQATVVSLSGPEFVINSVVVTPATIVLDVNLGPSGGTDCQVEVSNPSNGQTTIVDVLQINHAVPLGGIFAPVSAVEGHLKFGWSFDGVGMTPSTQFVPTGGLSAHGWYSTAGDLQVTSRTPPVRVEGTMSIACGDIGAVNFSVQNPGDPTGPFPLIGSMTTVASLVPGVTLVVPDSAEPGVSGLGVVVTANDVFIPSTILGSQYLSVSNVLATPGSPGQISFDIDVDAQAPQGSTQQLTAVNPCGQTELFNFDVEYGAPVITNWICSRPEENRPNVPCTIKGTGFDAAGVLTVLAPHNLIGFVRVDSETVTAEISFGPAFAPFSVTWTNPDTKFSTLPGLVGAEVAPSNIHVDVNLGVGAEEGAVGQKLRIYGHHVDPGAVGNLINFTNAALVSIDEYTQTYVEATIDITGVAGATITCDIQGIAGNYPVFVATINAAPTGATSITSFVPDGAPEFYENTPGQAFIMGGENLDDIANISVVYNNIDRSRASHEPWGPTPAATVTITSKSSAEIRGFIDIVASIAPWQIDIQAYNIFPALLDTYAGVDVALFPGPPPSPSLTDIPGTDASYGVPIAGVPLVFQLFTDFDPSDVLLIDGLGFFNVPPVWMGNHWLVDMTHGPNPGEIDAVVITRGAGPPGTETHYSNGPNT